MRFAAIALLFFFGTLPALAGGFGENPRLPPPYATQSVTKTSKAVGWPESKKPLAPEGFKVTRFGYDLRNPRWLYVLPNGDVLVAEAKSGPFALTPSANRISLLRDKDRDGIVDLKTVFLENLNKPFGMTLVGDYLYVANTDALLRFPYRTGDTKIAAAGEKILALPGGGNHWTRSVLLSPDGSRIFIGVGSASDAGEDGMEAEVNRAAIWQTDPDGKNKKIFATGLRNPVGMDWNPKTGALWTVVNERDKLGDNLVPDYLTQVEEGGFYGWPYSYFGQNEDPRYAGERPDLVKRAIVPDYALGSHTASLGLAFYNADAFPEKYRNGAFVGQHGSWNRSVFSGYKVIFIPFADGKPAGPPEDFLFGFIKDEEKREVYGRPVGVAVHNGALLVADDAGDTVWRVEFDSVR